VLFFLPYPAKLSASAPADRQMLWSQKILRRTAALPEAPQGETCKKAAARTSH